MALRKPDLRSFFDELEKIAEEKKDTKYKWLRNTAAIALGAGAGQGLAMLGDKLITDRFGPGYSLLPANKKRMLIGPALGAATVGAILAGRRLSEKSKE